MLTTAFGFRDMGLHPLKLTFPPELETSFRTEHEQSSLHQIRIALALIVLLCFTLLPLEILIAPDSSVALLVITLGGFVPLSLFMVFFTYRPAFRKRMQLYLLLVYIVGGSLIIAKLALIDCEIRDYFFVLLLLVYIYGYTLIKLRFPWATLGGALVSALFFVSALFYMELSPMLMASSGMFLISFNFLGMFACYHIELGARRSFYLLRLLSEEHQRVQAANLELDRRVHQRTAELEEKNRELILEIGVRQQVEVALRTSEEKYRSLYKMMRLMCDNVPDLIWAKDLEGRFLFVNKALCEKLLLAQDTEEPIGKTDSHFRERQQASNSPELTDSTMAEQCTATDIPVIAHRLPMRFDETGFINNLHLHLDVYKAPFWNQEGELIGTVGCGRIVTTQKLLEAERLKAEEALRESELKYRTLIEQSNDLILLIFQDRVELVNHRSLGMFGISPIEAQAEDFRLLDFVAPRSRFEMKKVYAKLQRNLELPRSFEFIALDRNGKEFEVEASITQVNYRDGVAVQAILRDVSERKRLEAQLLHAQKMEAIGRLAGGVAHDFNNFLTAIIGHCYLGMLSSQPGEPVIENLEEMQKAAERAAHLPRQLLAFSRKQKLEPKVIDLNVVIADMDKMLRRLIGEDIEFITLPAPDLWKVKVDPGQIEQVIVNLAVNSRDAMPNGGKIIIELKNVTLDDRFAALHEGLHAGNYVTLTVSDTGVGMTREVKEKIFDPFFTTKEASKGTGLGLSTVYGIVQQSGGSISVYSEPEKGTTIKIYLPRVEGLVESEERKAESPKALRGSETILVVEDEDAVRKSVISVLKRQGYKVLSARNGAEAEQLCRDAKRKIDLVVTDVVMPTISGTQMAKHLLQLWPTLKILYMSGYAPTTLLYQEKLGPETPFLQKPFRPSALVEKVREVLDRSE